MSDLESKNESGSEQSPFLPVIEKSRDFFNEAHQEASSMEDLPITEAMRLHVNALEMALGMLLLRTTDAFDAEDFSAKCERVAGLRGGSAIFETAKHLGDELRNLNAKTTHRDALESAARMLDLSLRLEIANDVKIRAISQVDAARE